MTQLYRNVDTESSILIPKKLLNPLSEAILDQEPDRAAANARFFCFATASSASLTTGPKYHQNTYFTHLSSSHCVPRAASLLTIPVKLIVNETRALRIMKERGEAGSKRASLHGRVAGGEWRVKKKKSDTGQRFAGCSFAGKA